MATKPECPYCGRTTGLRQVHDGCGSIPAEYTCEGCFTATDTGPCFDDLPLAPVTMTPREAGIQAFYADESTTNTLQGLNAAFDAYEAAAIASEGIDVLAYRMWSAHPKDLDPWRSTMPANYGGGVRAWFYASEIRGLFVSKAKEA